MPLFSFLLPTRKRTKGLYRFLQSVLEKTNRIEEIEITLCVDEDDVESHNIVLDGLSIKTIIVPPGATLGKLLRNCFSISSGRFVMFMNDDVVLRTKDWDLGVYSAFSSFSDDIGLVYVNELLFREKLCIFPVLSRKACLQIGVCSEEYRRYRIDDHIFDTYNMLALLGHRRIVYLPDVIFEHLNYQTAPQSDGEKFISVDGKVYVPDPEILKLDARLFDSLRESRKQEALKLAMLIDRPAHEEKLPELRHLLENVKDRSYQTPGFIRIEPLSTISEIAYEYSIAPQAALDEDHCEPAEFAIEIQELESICARFPLFQSSLVREISICVERAQKHGDKSKIRFCETLMSCIKNVSLESSASVPVLLTSYGGRNLVHYLQDIFIVPQSLGPLNLADRQDRERPEVISTRSLEAAKSIIDGIISN